MLRLCVFCGSNPGSNPAYADAARALGAEIARRGLGLIYGGGNVGLMGIVADAALEAGAEAIGVIPHALERREIGHRGLTRLHVVDSMHERKAMMADLADAFVALPGGVGTLEEFFEVVTWTQLGLHRKPCGLLNVAGFYDPLIEFLDHATRERFIRPQHRAIILHATDPAELIERLFSVEIPTMPKWISLRET